LTPPADLNNITPPDVTNLKITPAHLSLNMKKLNTRSRTIVTVASLLLAIFVLACGSGPPEIRPGFFAKPLSTEMHGRIVEKQYRLSGGVGTEGSINYSILEVNGTPLRIPNGYIESTRYCEVDGVEAVALQVRGTLESAGFYIFQLDGDEQIFERLCDYKMFMGNWEETKFTQCETGWDAATKSRVSS
jgi:hypothetical protein